MTVSQKVALSLLISVFLFAGFTVLAFTGLFDLVEARFYNPSITRGLTEEISRDADSVQNFLTELQNRFAATLRENQVKRSFLPNQSREDIFERTRIYGLLLESLGGLQWVRFIDTGGSRIHYSTYAQDILRQDRFSVAYRNYSDIPENLSYEQVEVPNQGSMKIIPDEKQERLLFSFPFYDSLDVYRGTALFSLSIRAVAEHLIREGRIKAGENISLLEDPLGFLTGLPYFSKDILLPKIAAIWNDGILSLSPLDSAGTSLVLVSAKTGDGIFIGRLVDESVFSFPQAMKIILLVSFFLTVYLTIFLVSNVKQDSLTVIQNRLRQLRLSLVEEYYDRQTDMDRERWNRELEHRREEIRAELKQGLKADQGTEKEIDVLIDKFWDELLRSIGDGRGVNAAAGMIDEKKLQAMLKRILETLSAESPAAKTAQEPVLEELESPSDFEELEELSKVEELEEFDQAEPAGLSPEKEPEAFEAAELEEIFEGSGLAEWAGDGSPASKKSLNPEEIDAAEAIIAKSPSRKRSNIQLAFGDDDIPYIVESSGLELVDEDFNSETAQPLIEKETPAAAGADDQDKFPEELEGFEELEELEPVEDAEELEPIDEVPVPEDFSLPPAQDMNDMASEIEFGFLPELEEDIPEGEEDLEIVSPFADIFSDFSEAGGETEKQAPEEESPESNREPSGDNSQKSPQAKINKAGLEELENNSAMSLISKPFLFENRLNPEYLETLEDSAPAALPAEEVIEERDGLPFINQASFYPPEDAGDIQDREFKDLVESVLKQGRTRP